MGCNQYNVAQSILLEKQPSRDRIGPHDSQMGVLYSTTIGKQALHRLSVLSSYEWYIVMGACMHLFIVPTPFLTVPRASKSFVREITPFNSATGTNSTQFFFLNSKTFTRYFSNILRNSSTKDCNEIGMNYVPY